MTSATVDAAWGVLAGVPDPEVPALSVCDLGIVRGVCVDSAGLEIVLTPTYSGCPATEAIERDIRDALEGAQLGPVRIRTQLAPAWTSAWISEEGRRKLRESGIAPPGHVVDGDASLPIRFMPRISTQSASARVACPRCESSNTEQLSAFGSTVCKSLWRCLACREPFENFKPI